MWDGRESARHVIILTEQLVLNPHSRVFAIRGGSPELQGWDAATVILARHHNLMASLLQGLSKGERDPKMFIQYPGSEDHEVTLQPKTIAELYGVVDNFTS